MNAMDAGGGARPRRTWAELGIVIGLLAAPAAAIAQGVAPPLAKPSQEHTQAPAAQGPDGEKYLGPSPGSPARNPLPVPKPEPPSLVWTGFKMGEGGSQVFLQTTRPVTYEIKVPDPEKKAAKGKRAGTMSVFLRNCRIHLANNRRNLDTRFFATPVSGVSARQSRKDVELRISLKESSAPTPRTEEGPDGTQFVVLAFPPGKAETPPQPKDEGGGFP